jgi:hypothetical protein
MSYEDHPEDNNQFELFEHEPTDEEVEWFASKLGMNKQRDAKFFYIAREGNQY